MQLLPAGRRGRALAAVVVVLVLAAAVLVAVGRPDVTWSVEVDEAGAVRDWDDDRLLLGSRASGVVALDRADGDETSRYDAPADTFVEQVALVPGGYLVQWTSANRGSALVMVADDGTEVWRADEDGGLRMRGVLVEDGVVSVAIVSDVGRQATLRGLDLDDGAVRWERDVVDFARTLDDGPDLRSVGVVLADLGPPGVADGGTTVLDLADGAELGTMDVELEAGTTAVYWRDVVLVADGERWQRTVAGAVAPIEGLDRAVGLEGTSLFTRVGDGLVTTDFDGATWGVDLEAGTVVRLPAASAYVEQASGLSGQVDDDELLLVDVGSGEVDRSEVATRSYVAAGGPDAVLLVESLGRLAAWRHLLGAEDAARVTVVDRDGERHGDLALDRDDVAAGTVLDGHEAVVVVSDGDTRRVVLLGR